MKKTILIAAALSAAGAACSQSSVVLFGVVDASLSSGSGSIADRTQMHRGGLTSNRLGFRGSESLGGGLTAHFWLESGMNVDDGTGQASNTNNQASGATGAGGLTFNRRSTIGLEGAWGELRLGRDFVPQYWNLVNGDPFGNVGVGAAVNFTAIITGATNTRASNMISYISPKQMGGFVVQLSHYRGENPGNAANADDGTGTGVRIAYEQGPLLVGVATSGTDYATGNVKQSNANAAWNFGVAKVMGTYNVDEMGTLKARGLTLGTRVPFGLGEFKAAYSRHKTNAAGDPGAAKYAFGYVHNLSKRTALYATYARVTNKGGSAISLNGSVTGPNTSSSGVDLGVRHVF